MRSLLLAVLLSVLPVFAQEVPPPEVPVVPEEVPEPPVPEIRYEPPAPVIPQDSPLVAAAKKSHRKDAKTSIVITNATLKQSGANAHVTTTARQAAIGNTAAGPAKTPQSAQAGRPRPSKKHARQAPPPPHHDADQIYEDDPKGENTHCPTCLPVLDPVPPNLPVQQAEPSAQPPRTATPSHDAPQVVTPVQPEVIQPPSR